mgnify:CR=1 FL=1
MSSCIFYAYINESSVYTTTLLMYYFDRWFDWECLRYTVMNWLENWLREQKRSLLDFYRGWLKIILKLIKSMHAQPSSVLFILSEIFITQPPLNSICYVMPIIVLGGMYKMRPIYWSSFRQGPLPTIHACIWTLLRRYNRL